MTLEYIILEKGKEEEKMSQEIITKKDQEMAEGEKEIGEGKGDRGGGRSSKS